MLKAKQRADLRSKANNLESLWRIGKNGVTPETVKSVDEALEANELIKITVLNNCETEVRDAAQIISERTRSDIVQVIGRKIVLYRKQKERLK